MNDLDSRIRQLVGEIVDSSPLPGAQPVAAPPIGDRQRGPRHLLLAGMAGLLALGLLGWNLIPVGEPDVVADRGAASSATPPAPGGTGIPAFPGAEGFGAGTAGGRGGRVVEVTNLNDSGEGSLRHALAQRGPRIVVFRVGGTIEVESTIEVDEPFVTIAGQTAPGGGIALKNAGNESETLKIATHDVVIRFLRIRPGPGGGDEADGIALSSAEARNIVIDHSSITWGVDESVSFYTGDRSAKIHDVTIQWSVISDALNCSTHDEGCHSMGLLIQYADRVSVHHNLFANNGGRSPMILSGDIQVSNNVITNWGGAAVKIENRHGDVRANVVGNYFRPGQDSDMSENGIQVKTDGVQLYLEDNYASHVRPDDEISEDAIVNFRKPATIVESRFPFPHLTLTSPQSAYEAVLAGSGATLPQRDRVDADIVRKVREDRGSLIDDPSDVGGYPTLAPGSPPADSDRDGMPDEWELGMDLDPGDRTDGNGDHDGDGYTNVEEYLNSLVGQPDDATPGVAAPPIDEQPTTVPPTTVPSETVPSTPVPPTTVPPRAEWPPTGDGIDRVCRVTASIVHGDDDVEERVDSGEVDRSSSDLELGQEADQEQLVGLRYEDVGIPSGATITDARLLFHVDERSVSKAELDIGVEASPNPRPFSDRRGDISARGLLPSTVPWTPGGWAAEGDHGSAQRSPDLTRMMQALVDGGDWTGDSDLVFVVAGTGRRTAMSRDGEPGGAPHLAPQLTVDYIGGDGTGCGPPR